MSSLFSNSVQDLFEYQEIQRTPREVQIGWGVKTLLILSVFILMISGYFLVSVVTKGWPRDIVNFASIVGIFILMLMILSREAFQLARDYRLLKAGKCALGKIIAQRKVGAGRQKRSEITYQFPVGPGKPMTARGIDITGTYSPNMSIVIFYDPDDFSKNVGICCTNWRVRTQGGHLLEA